MSKELSLVLVDEEIAFQSGPGMARLWVSGIDSVPLDLDDLGKMAEWISVAWENVAGEPYNPEYIGEIVTDRGFADIVQVERDCE